MARYVYDGTSRRMEKEVSQMFGTGVEEYDDLTECVVSLLQVQADHHASERSEGNPN